MKLAKILPGLTMLMSAAPCLANTPERLFEISSAEDLSTLQALSPGASIKAILGFNDFSVN
jgi:hypothetical protein